MERLETEAKNESTYLFYFQPGEDLKNLILEQDDLKLPKSGLHTTLCIFNMQQKILMKLKRNIF